LKFRVLWKLYNHGYWGKRHIAKRDICKGLPSHEQGNCFGVVADLVKSGVIVRIKHRNKAHGSTDRYFLNRSALKEIKEFLEGFEEK